MKTQPLDPVIAEIHAIKDGISAEFGHNIDALFRHLRAMEKDRRLAVDFQPRRSVRAGQKPRTNRRFRTASA